MGWRRDTEVEMRVEMVRGLCVGVLVVGLVVGCGADEAGAGPEREAGSDAGAVGPGDGAALGDAAADTGPAVASFCEGEARFLYAPDDPTFLGAFPDDFWTVDDASAVTGERIALSPDNAAWIASDVPPNFQANVMPLNGLGDWCQTPLRTPRRDLRRAEAPASA